MSNVAETIPGPTDQEDLRNSVNFAPLRGGLSPPVQPRRGWRRTFCGVLRHTSGQLLDHLLRKYRRPALDRPVTDLFMKDRQLFWKLRPNVETVFPHHRVSLTDMVFEVTIPCPAEGPCYFWETLYPSAGRLCSRRPFLKCCKSASTVRPSPENSGTSSMRESRSTVHFRSCDKRRL